MSTVDWNARPQRADGIEINEIPDGYVIYDPNRDRVHYLNQTAVLLLELCNGQVTTRELPALLRDAYNLPEPPTEEVAEYMQKLVDEGLVR